MKKYNLKDVWIEYCTLIVHSNEAKGLCKACRISTWANLLIILPTTTPNHEFQKFNIHLFIFKLCKNISLQLCLSRPNESESVSEYISIVSCKPQFKKRGGFASHRKFHRIERFTHCHYLFNLSTNAQHLLGRGKHKWGYRNSWITSKSC